MRSVVLVAVLLLAGCASALTRTPPERPAPPLPAGQVVFRVETGGGLTSVEHYLSGRPRVTVYGDGTAYVATGRNGSAGYRPIALDRGTVPPGALAGLVSDAEDSGLFDGRVDFGGPRVTDMPGTAVAFRPGRAAAREVTAYALDYTAGDDDLTTPQRLARASLRRLIAAVESAVTGAGPWLPERLEVTQYDSRRTGGPQAWPGPPLAGVLRPVERSRCGQVTGAAARRVYEVARTADSPLWRDGATVRSLLFRVLLPGERACAGR